MGSIKALVWTLLGGGFTYLYMTDHFIKANAVMVLWIAAFSWHFVVSTKKYNRKEER